MSKVLGDKQRARTAKEKDRRRDSIVQAALELLLEQPGSLPTMTRIAQRAGVSKGTTYIYFDTKESIYLALLEDDLHAWLADIETALSYQTDDKVGWLVAALLNFQEKQPNLWTLASLSHAVIELNIDSKALLSYKTKLAQRFKSTAKAIRLHLDVAENMTAETEAMLMQSYAFLLGQWQVCHPPQSIAKLLKGPGFKILQPDFTSTAKQGLEQQWQGFVERIEKKPEQHGMLNRLFRRS